ncbi:hypothetical protein BDW72DRAFT_184639 [Aspergillus terricola var. indicus]
MAWFASQLGPLGMAIVGRLTAGVQHLLPSPLPVRRCCLPGNSIRPYAQHGKFHVSCVCRTRCTTASPGLGK